MDASYFDAFYVKSTFFLNVNQGNWQGKERKFFSFKFLPIRRLLPIDHLFLWVWFSLCMNRVDNSSLCPLLSVKDELGNTLPAFFPLHFV